MSSSVQKIQGRLSRKTDPEGESGSTSSNEMAVCVKWAGHFI